MRKISYVILNPSGNLTALVLSPVEAALRESVTAALMAKSEQVGYLETPGDRRATARLQMMGGEFCGNASMATAAWLWSRGKAEDGIKDSEKPATGENCLQMPAPDTHCRVTLEVSGAEGLLDCELRALPDGFEGTVEMPPVLEIKPLEWPQREATLVRIEGIAHVILPGEALEDTQAETLLREIAKELPDEAVGLLQWQEIGTHDGNRDPALKENRQPLGTWAEGRMRPLVLVKESNTLVWETGCGSGSAAIGAWQKAKTGRRETLVYQPGGCIRVSFSAAGRPQITGHVSLGEESILEIDA